MTRRTQGYLGLSVVAATAVTLIAVELSQGALAYGESASRDPCTARTSYPGEDIDATLQRIVLRGLNGAACELGASREELVLSFDRRIGPEEIEWDRRTIERAVRSGLLRAVDEARDAGEIGGATARILTEVIERAPLDLLIGGGLAIADLLERVPDLDLGDLLRPGGSLP